VGKKERLLKKQGGLGVSITNTYPEVVSRAEV
jgi:hypothetical protein